MSNDEVGREMAVGSSHEDVDFESASESQTLSRGSSMTAGPMQPFVIDVPAMEQRAIHSMHDGPLTQAYTADPQQVVKVLNDALATELVCTMRYRSHYYAVSGVPGKTVAAEFLEHANEEQLHVDWLAKRITQLHGTPNFDPRGLADRSHAKFQQGGSLREMIEEDLVAERVAIEIYSELIRWLGDRDITTRRIIEDILAMEEVHAEDLLQLLAKI